jgi:hypothetical protein
VSNEERERNLARLAEEARIRETRAAHWEHRYRGLVKADELESRGNAALLDIVRNYKDERGGFEDYCRGRGSSTVSTSPRAL